MTVFKIPVWLDCDPGHDDTIALLLAACHPSFELIGVSTTHGNASLVNTTYNALAMLTAIGAADIPVYAGSARPLEKDPHYAPGIHGENGLGGIDIPEPTCSAMNTIGDEDFMIDALYAATEKYKGELAVVPVGPLTNIAKLFRKYPQAKYNIKVLSIMGGGIFVHNIGKGAEFNIYCDPKAADEIFTDSVVGPKTILVPLDVTHTVVCTQEIQDQIKGQSRLRKIVHDLMVFFADTYKREQNKFSQGPPVHDPVALYVLLEEYGIENVGVEYKKYALKCAVTGENEGQIHFEDDEKNGSKVVFGIDVQKFWRDLLKVLELTDHIN